MRGGGGRGNSSFWDEVRALHYASGFSVLDIAHIPS